MKLCIIENCNSKYYCKGYCIKHYQRYKRNLPMNMLYKSRDEYQRGNTEFEHRSRDSWSRSVKKFFGDICMLCGWNKSSCDVHHIISRKNNGKNTISNAIVLCPNHHRLADKQLIEIKELIEINKKAIH